jgi:phosphoglycerate dehydrogenase-like enzyme
MKVLSYFQLHEVRWAIPPQDLEAFGRRFPSVRFTSLETPDNLEKEIVDADVFVGWIFPKHLFGHAKQLRWVHSASAGVEANLFAALVESDVVLTNAAGLHSVSIPEHVIALMLTLARNLHHAQRMQAEKRWDRFGTIINGVGVRELHGSHLAIIGAGAIGTALVPLASAFGMKVRILRRRPENPIEGVEAVVGPADLHALLGWADFVVLAAPLTPETRNMIDGAALAAMQPHAFLINVARGEMIDDDALVDALRRGAIAGAGLDAVREEPLPATSPYWSMPNVVLTPHVSGYTPGYFDRVLAMFGDNLERFLRGAPLENVVNKRAGYVQRGNED